MNKPKQKYMLNSPQNNLLNSLKLKSPLHAISNDTNQSINIKEYDENKMMLFNIPKGNYSK